MRASTVERRFGSSPEAESAEAAIEVAIWAGDSRGAAWLAS